MSYQRKKSPRGRTGLTIDCFNHRAQKENNQKHLNKQKTNVNKNVCFFNESKGSLILRLFNFMVFIESLFSSFLKNHVFFCFEFPWADDQEWQDQPDQPDQLVLAPWRCLGSAVVVKQTKHTVTKPCFQSASLWKSKTENNSWQTMVNLRVRTLSGGGEGGRWRCLYIRFHMVLTSLHISSISSFWTFNLFKFTGSNMFKMPLWVWRRSTTKVVQVHLTLQMISEGVHECTHVHKLFNSHLTLFEDTLVPHSFQRTLLRLAPLHEKLVG